MQALTVDLEEFLSNFNFSNSSDYNFSDYDFIENGVCKQTTTGISQSIAFPLLVMLILTAIVGNVWLLFKLIQNGIKKLCHVVMVAMCINAFFGCLVMLLYILQYIIKFSTVLCQTFNLMFGFYVFFGVLLVCILCFDTWFAIWLPAIGASSSRCGIFCCLFAAIVALSLALPKAIFMEALELSPGVTMCHINWGAETAQLSFDLRMCLNVCGFLLPFLFLLVFYGMCVYKLCRAVFRAKARAMRSILVLILLFLLCWGPYHLFNFLDGLLRDGVLQDSCIFREMLGLGIEITTWWGLGQTALQPIVYACCSTQLRSQLFSCFCKR